MKKLPQISEAEYQVMKIIWKYAPISTNEVIEKLVKTSKWSPKTIQTMLLRLVKKGALTYEKNSRVFVYTPIVKEEEYVATESSSFLNRFYNGTLNSMVLNFLENDKLSEDDIEELRHILDKRKTKEDK
ncbi:MULTISPECIES: BlaI/MecI/CopY family transcriptional regulator [unclassified Clostridioides]|uniref:BlaI/MecI/CopY family transcriptional regulator n=1 Tax=unclassified Clostridioides TaxID=2635829 RepID=UPI001D117644|nr:BlaI/MecI/CopY family transcriptional regulator [Clostridioides sp. ZZV15-6388]MCC0645710.1 BlaI/MecI/CopY family transcriptional regulator [Clostridioides sp. ZZV14-6150]MCC0661927.1 BlaI/MecI/CopY family transcriptional regulator [Clostridioides sp. ZZV14-6154]MCC0666345.1 BlaI/MecI/CopY family transcriptional regulator [Clostridioides sp. ZZV15-6597]MCC0669724.1 BlaI/MecI/CopY family transcriptional regulator [Clostridioides sp. ZZV14-6153]MCC0718850.1 BlaI/MecI/CopY family transcription